MTTWSGIVFIAFLLLSIVNIIGLRSDDGKVNRCTKPLLMPLLTIVPLQIFACEVATLKGYDVDQPRNLAKSVTVE